MAKLTPKQKQVYEYILAFTAEHGYSPSIREISLAVGLKSPSTVHFHLKGLLKAGVILQEPGKTRTITFPDTPHGVPVVKPRTDQIPIVGNVAAGSPILAQEYIEDYLPFDVGGAPEEHFALRVRGESMLGIGILPGDLVIVHRQPEANNGEIVVALFEDEATVKTLSCENGKVWLLPQNPDYEPIDGTNAKIIGRVVAVVRRY
jgi:repressor LexA